MRPSFAQTLISPPSWPRSFERGFQAPNPNDVTADLVLVSEAAARRHSAGHSPSRASRALSAALDAADRRPSRTARRSRDWQTEPPPARGAPPPAGGTPRDAAAPRRRGSGAGLASSADWTVPSSATTAREGAGSRHYMR